MHLRPLAVALSALILAACHDGARTHAVQPHDGGVADTLTVLPGDATLSVTAGTASTLQFTASLNGQSVAAAWSIAPSALGSIDGNGLFTASGAAAGKATITARYGGASGSTTLTIALTIVQNGDPGYTPTPVAPGAGGYGGVGGDGPGGPVSPTQQQTLDGTPTADGSVQLLYPYDGTVWPRGLLPPLLQWRSGTHKFDSVMVKLSENGYQYKGYFAANNAAAFVNLPLPAGAWQALGDGNQGDAATVSIVFGEGAKAYGPYRMSWKFASAALKGSVYYNSYGTYLVSNSDTPDASGKRYGAATLSIRPGATAPTIVAGVASASDGTGCRVCHTVSANGKTLLTQASNGSASDYTDTRFIDLLNDTSAGAGAPIGSGLAYPALSPDGSLLLSSSGGFAYPSSPAQPSQLFAVSPSRTQLLTPTGLPAGFSAALPVFSPDGAHVAFNFWSGTFGGTSGDQRSLGMIDFDVTTQTFSKARVLYTPASNVPVTFSSFLPTGQGIVFQVELANPSGSWGYTWQGNTGELWWVDVNSGSAARLDRLNGVGYAPDNGAGGTHPPGLDATLNYEPTVNPIASGGYAWIVFTSRRMYGNVATEDPWMSDPRKYDATTHVTDKKLWVAAFDLNAPAGSDPSHPAFYLPGQELHAGNARGYWTAGPCQPDGTSCSSGDQCCGGYCPVEGGGSCTSTPPACSSAFDKCNTDADCCSNQGLTCINHVCTAKTPPIS